MSRIGAWLPALVMLAAGFGGGYLVGSGDAPPDAPAPLLDGGGDGASPSRTTSELMSVEATGPALAPTPESAALHAALEVLPAPRIERGSGVITGVVKTDAGQPLAGAEVEITAHYPPDQKPGAWKHWQDAPLEDVVRRTVARHRWNRAMRQEATSGADGSFRFAELTDTTHQVTCEHPDYLIHPVDHQSAYQAEPGAKVEFVARVIVPVTIEILMPDGTTPDRANVRFESNGSSWGTGWSSQEKTVKQKPGTYQLKVTAGDSNEYEAEPQTVVLRLGEPQSLTVNLSGRPVLRGNLVYAEGEAFDNARVYLMRLGSGERPDAARLKNSDKNVWVHRGHRRGADFTFTDLLPGRYVLGMARAHNGDIVAMEVVQVGEGLTEQDLRVPALAREDYAILTVYGPDGVTLQDVQVSMGYRYKGGSSSGGTATLKRPDGSLWVLHQKRGMEKDSTGEHFVTVTSVGHGTVEETYTLSSRVELKVQFLPPGTLEVQVGGVMGTGYEGRVKVGVAKLRDGAEGGRRRTYGGHRSGKLDKKGKTTRTGLQPGTYQLSLTVSSEHRTNSVLTKTVRVGSGTNSVRLELPELYSITVTGAQGSVTLRTKTKERSRFRSSYWGRADSQGRAVFDALPAGTYEVRSQRKKVEITLPGRSEIDLR